VSVSCSFGGLCNRLFFNDGNSFLRLLPFDGLVLDELFFGIDDENFIKTIRRRKTIKKFMIFGPFSGSFLEVERTDGNLLEVLVPSNVRLERVSSSMSVSNTSSRLVGKFSLFILDKYSITFALIAKFLCSLSFMMTM